ncbi:unnamed protein product [Rhizophagus irregularis]|nr:unnamed protein product [Rhizophagus irregularis]
MRSHTSHLQDIEAMENKGGVKNKVQCKRGKLHSYAIYETLNDTDYKISSENWNEITKIIKQNRKTMPMGFGRPPINIQKHHSAFKVEDWYNWIVLYSLPLLHDHLPTRYLIY